MKRMKEQSLHYQVEKWISPGCGPVRVTQFSRTHGNKRRYVCVEASESAASRALFFFHHEDGNWYVYPPAPERTSVTKAWVAA
jgi:hypothetical protein